MVLGTWSRKDTLYGGEGYSVTGNGDLAEQLQARDPPPAGIRSAASISGPGTNPPRPSRPRRRSATSPKAASSSATTASFASPSAARPCPSSTAARRCKADGTLTGKRLAALIGLRDRARRVLQSQNEGWPEADRNDARRELNWAYDRFASTYGPINKTTFGETADGSVIRRMPNLVKFREDPDAMLVMSLEDYDEVTGKATKAAIMHEGRGRQDPARHARSAAPRKDCSSPSTSAARSICRSSPRSTASPKTQVIAELGDLIFHDPESRTWQTADAYLSGNVRAKLAAAERAGPAYARNAEALRAVQPEDVLPGDIDANLGAPWIPGERHPGLRRRPLPRRAVVDPGRPPEEGCRLEHRRRLRRRSSRSPRRPSSARRAPTAPGSWSWPST